MMAIGILGTVFVVGIAFCLCRAAGNADACLEAMKEKDEREI